MIERNKGATNNTTDSRKLTNMFRINRSLTTQTFNKEVLHAVHILFSGAKKANGCFPHAQRYFRTHDFSFLLYGSITFITSFCFNFLFLLGDAVNLLLRCEWAKP